MRFYFLLGRSEFLARPEISHTKRVPTLELMPMTKHDKPFFGGAHSTRCHERQRPSLKPLPYMAVCYNTVHTSKQVKGGLVRVIKRWIRARRATLERRRNTPKCKDKFLLSFLTTYNLFVLVSTGP
jgi:hypothetical protein